MKNEALLAFALLVAGASMAQPSLAATGDEPAAGATEPMKGKPAKHKAVHHKHERHSHYMKAHKAHRAV